jgi:PAS domain S-box-containing protein
MFMTRRLTRPLHFLTEGANRIGRGELATRIPVQSRDEFGRLANGFNQMAANLQETLTTLQHREEHFRALIENSSDIVTVLDANGVILFHSPSTERLLGYAREALVGKRVFELVHPDDMPDFKGLVEDQAPVMVASTFTEIRIRHQDGSWRTLEATGQNLLDHPAVAGIVVNARDISKRKKAETALQQAYQELEQRVQDRTRELSVTNQRLRQEIDERQQAVDALRANEQKMRAILMASPVGIGLVIDRKLDWGNDTLFRMVGYEKTYLIGRRVELLYPNPDEYARVGRKLYGQRSLPEIRQVETRLIRGDGTMIDCTIRAYPLDSEDSSKGQIVVVSDTSEAKRMEAELQRARKMEAIGTLAGGVAHDLIIFYPVSSATLNCYCWIFPMTAL